MINSLNIESALLDDFGKLLNIEGNYGGNQYWFYSENKSKYLSVRTCGLIAAMNLICYIAKTNVKFSGLMKEDINLQNYMALGMELLQVFRVSPIGIFDINYLVNGIISYGESKGVNMIPAVLDHIWSMDDTYKYIRDGIKSGSPILMVTWFHRIKELSYHWVTITGIEKKKDGNISIITSNWGKEKVYDFVEWYKSYSLYKGLIYFI